jgi:hypothetical protein
MKTFLITLRLLAAYILMLCAVFVITQVTGLSASGTIRYGNLDQWLTAKLLQSGWVIAGLCCLSGIAMVLMRPERWWTIFAAVGSSPALGAFLSSTELRGGSLPVRELLWLESNGLLADLLVASVVCGCNSGIALVLFYLKSRRKDVPAAD